MLTLEDVACMVSAFTSDTFTSSASTDHGFYGHASRLSWSVNGHTFAWVRPYSKADLKKLGDTAPGGTILAVHVGNQTRKDHWLEEAGCDAIFTIPHFAGYPAVLVALDEIEHHQLEPLLRDAHLIAATKKPKRKKP